MAGWADFFQKQELAAGAREDRRAKEFARLQALAQQEYYARQGNEAGAVGVDVLEQEKNANNRFNYDTQRAQEVFKQSQSYITNIAEEMQRRGLSPEQQELEWQGKYQPMLHKQLSSLFPQFKPQAGSWQETILNMDRAKTTLGMQEAEAAKQTGKMQAGVIEPFSGGVIAGDIRSGFQKYAPGLGVQTPNIQGAVPEQQVPTQGVLGTQSNGQFTYPGVIPGSRQALEIDKQARDVRNEARLAESAKSTKAIEKFKAFEGISNSFKTDATDYNSVKDAVSSIRSLNDALKPDASGKYNITAATALATKVAKLLDPTTGVKEAELRNILAGNQGLYEKIQSWIPKLKQGPAYLTEEQKGELLQVSNLLNEANRERYVERANPRRKSAEGLKNQLKADEVDLGNVVPYYDADIKSKTELAKALKEQRISPKEFLVIRNERGW